MYVSVLDACVLYPASYGDALQVPTDAGDVPMLAVDDGKRIDAVSKPKLKCGNTYRRGSNTADFKPRRPEQLHAG